MFLFLLFLIGIVFMCLTMSTSTILIFLGGMFTMSLISKLMTLLFMILMMMMVISLEEEDLNMYMYLSFMLLMFLSTQNLFLFFSTYELSVIPLFFLIIKSGQNPERVNSFMYMYMYMYISFIPSVASVMWMNWKLSPTLSLKNMSIFNTNMKQNFMSGGLALIMVITFLVKVPSFFFHSWLPKAHTESPVSGSMLLASVYLKMGCFGVIKFEVLFNNLYFNKKMMLIFVLGGVMISVVASMQSDSKRIVALSSVTHMSLFLGLFFTLESSVMVLFFLIGGHSFISLICFLINHIYYKKFKSRSLVLFSGISNLNALLMVLLLVIVVLNFTFPQSMSFWGEVASFCYLYENNKPMMMALLFFLMMWVLMYNIKLLINKVYQISWASNKDLHNTVHMLYPLATVTIFMNFVALLMV